MAAGDTDPLGRLFRPTGVALVGATEKAIWTASIFKSFEDYGYEGGIYAVNREGRDILGYPGFASCTDIEGPLDAAYILVPVKAIREAVADVIAAGVKLAVVLTSGFAEIGPEGAALQDEIVAMARAGGLTLFGPNSLGFVNIADRSPVTSLQARLPLIDGGVGLISQSGATANELLEIAHRHRLGLSFVAATGNEAMVGLPQLIDFLIGHAPTKAIAIYAETISDPQALRDSAVRAAAAGKPIVILKVGSSEISEAVAAAHTGAMVGDDQVFDAACRKLAMVRVRTPEDLMLTSALLARGTPEKPGIGVVSISGGACGMIADLAEPLGVELPAFAEATVERLRTFLPPFASTLNPLDITGGAIADPSLFAKAIEAVGADPAIGSVYVVYPLPATKSQLRLNPFPHIGEGARAAGVPVAVWTQSLQPVTTLAGEVMAGAGLDFVLNGLENGLRSIAGTNGWAAMRGKACEAVAMPEVEPGRRSEIVDERSALAYLASRGVGAIPSQLVASRKEAATAATEIGGKLALKVSSPDIAHKTEVGGVRLGVAGAADAADGFDTIMASVGAARPDARLDGVIVSPMRQGGQEVFVGVARDQGWGPVIAVGLGGIWVELLEDSRLALLPVSAEEVKGMLSALRGGALLQGFRGSEPADLDVLAEAIVRIGDAALALGPELAAFEINPLRVKGDAVEALDALAIWDALPA